MAETRPTGEQLRFVSAATGEHNLDTYLEASEKGGRTLPDLLDDLFDGSGDFNAALFEFRVNTSTQRLQVRVGTFVDPNVGWVNTNEFIFRARGAYANATAYERLDIVSHDASLYICATAHTSSTATPGPNFMLSATLDLTAVNAAIAALQSDVTDLENTRALAATTINAAGLATGGGSLAANRTITVTASTANEVRAGSSTSTTPTPSSLASSAAFQVLTDAATIAWDTALGYNARVTLTAAGRAMGGPTNLKDGLTYTLLIAQDATGSRTITSWNAVFDWGAAGAPSLSTGANKADLAFGIYSAFTGKLHMSFRRAA